MPWESNEDLLLASIVVDYLESTAEGAASYSLDQPRDLMFPVFELASACILEGLAVVQSAAAKFAVAAGGDDLLSPSSGRSGPTSDGFWSQETPGGRDGVPCRDRYFLLLGLLRRSKGVPLGPEEEETQRLLPQSSLAMARELQGRIKDSMSASVARGVFSHLTTVSTVRSRAALPLPRPSDPMNNRAGWWFGQDET